MSKISRFAIGGGEAPVNLFSIERVRCGRPKFQLSTDERVGMYNFVNHRSHSVRTRRGWYNIEHLSDSR